MPLEDAQREACSGVPKPCRAVTRPRDHRPSVRAERCPVDAVGVTAQDDNRLPGGGVPNSGGAVGGRGYEPLPRWVELGAPHDVLVTTQDRDLRAASEVPDSG